MFNNRAIRISFLISLSIHLLLLSLPLFDLRLAQAKSLEGITVELITEKPALYLKKKRPGSPPKSRSKFKVRFNQEPAAKPNLEPLPKLNIEPILKELSALPEIEEGVTLAQDTISSPAASIPSGPGQPVIIERTGDDKQTGENFFHLVKKKIEQSKYYPEWARERGIEGVVRISFLIVKEGNIDEMNVVASSGYKVLDETALDTIKRASPFPTPPRSLGEGLVITIPIVYRLLEE